jgi:hypothetical protein
MGFAALYPSYAGYSGSDPFLPTRALPILHGLEDDDLASGLIESSPIRAPLRSLGELGKVVMSFYTPALRYNYQG